MVRTGGNCKGGAAWRVCAAAGANCARLPPSLPLRAQTTLPPCTPLPSPSPPPPLRPSPPRRSWRRGVTGTGVTRRGGARARRCLAVSGGVWVGGCGWLARAPRCNLLPPTPARPPPARPPTTCRGRAPRQEAQDKAVRGLPPQEPWCHQLSKWRPGPPRTPDGPVSTNCNRCYLRLASHPPPPHHPARAGRALVAVGSEGQLAAWHCHRRPSPRVRVGPPTLPGRLPRTHPPGARPHPSSCRARAPPSPPPTCLPALPACALLDA